MKRVSPINSHIFYQKSYIGGQGVVPRGAVSPYRTFFKITPPGLNTASLIAYFGILKDKKTYKGNLRWNICATITISTPAVSKDEILIQYLHINLC